MTTIIYVDNKPFVCFDFILFDFKLYKQIVYCNIIFNVKFYDTDMRNNNIKKVWCAIGKEINTDCIFIGANSANFDLDKFDICNNPAYSITPGKITPVWFENDHGKQITFLIE